MSKIKVVVAGVGNCCSALVQSVHYHAENPKGLMNYDLGGLKPSDIKVVGGIDIDSRKVGRDLSEAIFAEPNVAPRFCNPPPAGVVVVKGPVLDGADGVLKDVIQVDSAPLSMYLHIWRNSMRRSWCASSPQEPKRRLSSMLTLR